jgi:hypothetical protein
MLKSIFIGLLFFILFFNSTTVIALEQKSNLVLKPNLSNKVSENEIRQKIIYSDYLSKNQKAIEAITSIRNKVELKVENPRTGQVFFNDVDTTASPTTAQISISKIGINKHQLALASSNNISELENKLVENAVLESQITNDLCSTSGNSYIYGHSESPSPSIKGNAVNIFAKLHTLVENDIIEVTNTKGVSCKYQVLSWDKLVTDNKDMVTVAEFNRALYFEEAKNYPTLTIQTCELGSATVRLLLRAKKVS